jgi:VWFA-related protein
MQIQNVYMARNLIGSFLAFFIFACVSFGQTPTPENDTIRVNTDLIQTNITVLDKNKRFVDGLKSEQFELRVDGKVVPISFFERVAATTRANEKQTNQINNSQTSNVASGNPSLLRERKIIFFVDDLHLSLDSLARTRSAIAHFIDDEMMPRDSVLIVSASGRLGFLQQFTDHKAVLRAALARLKPIPNIVRDSEPPPMTEFVALRIVNGDREAAAFYIAKIMEGFNIKNVTSISPRAAYEMVKNRANNIVSGLVSVSEASLETIEILLRTLNQIGGRKLIFVASDGFYLGSKNGGTTDNIRLQRVVNEATRSGSTIYTIDARGLFSSAAADASGERPVDPNAHLDRGRVSEDMLSQEALFTLAEQTGGQFLKNQNYFDKWIDKTLDENSNYYVLAWSPEKELQSEMKFRRVEVSVIGRPELTVRLQRGYLTGTNKNEAKNKNNKKENADEKPIEAVTPIAVEQTQKGKPLATNLSLNYLDVPNVGAVLTSSVQVKTGKLDYGDGKQAAKIDVGGVVFNDQGKQVADFKTGLNVTPRPQDADQSVIYNNRTPLPPGIYQVRIGAREPKTGQTGTATKWIEIPDLNRKDLTLASLLLGVKEVKKSDKPEDVQIQFSVDHQFARPLQLDFMSFIYNASRAANGEINLASKIEIFDAQGRAIVNTPMRTLSTKELTDLSRIPLTGTIRQQTSVPGSYLLRVTVTDLTANKTAVEQTVFTIE